MDTIKIKSNNVTKILLLIILITILTTCNKDNSNPVITDTGLIGTWVATNVSGATPQGEISLSAGLIGIVMTIEFRGDNTAWLRWMQQGQTTIQNFAWITFDGTIIFTPAARGTVIVLPYTKAGSKINVGFTNILPSINYNGVVITSVVMEFSRQIN
jgi:hypothetical protein